MPLYLETPRRGLKKLARGAPCGANAFTAAQIQIMYYPLTIVFFNFIYIAAI